MASGSLQCEFTRAVAIARSSFETTGGRRRVDARHVHARDDAAKRRAIEATRRSDATRSRARRDSGDARARATTIRTVIASHRTHRVATYPSDRGARARGDARGVRRARRRAGNAR